MKLYLGLGALALGSAVVGLGLAREKGEAGEPPAIGYVMHEWGTFTSVHGSNGKMLAGLQREEEHLPAFVRAHAGMENRGGIMMKGWRRPMKNVIVKMETPVIYFYSDEGFKGSVEVGFKGGSISQWWPPRQGGEVPPKYDPPKFDPNATPEMRAAYLEKMKVAGMIDFGDGKYEGSIKWEFEVMAPDSGMEAEVFRSGETLNWLRPRQTGSNIVKAGGICEKYLFYRGVGNFEVPMQFKVDSEETLTITNTSSEAVPYALVFEKNVLGRVGIYELAEGIEPGKTILVGYEELFPPSGEEPRYLAKAVGPEYKKMIAGLVKSGLRHDEASAMVQTWWDSYFGKPGLRVFWVVPQGETERILPLEITPKPKEMVRVLVGRSEVLRPGFEKQLVKEYQAEKKTAWNARWNSGFGAAYLQRVEEILPTTVTTVAR
jgi:hypothetical protein